MLLLLISLFSNYVLLIHCDRLGKDNFKTQLSAKMHKSIREMDALLRDFKQEIQKQKSVLRTIDLADNLKDIGFLDYSITPMWWEGTLERDQTERNNAAITFLPTPVGHGMTNSSEDPQHKKNLRENLNPLPGIKINSSAGPFDVVLIPEHRPHYPDYPLDQTPYTFPNFPLPTLTPVDPYYFTFYPTNATSISFTRPVYTFSVTPRTAPSPSAVPDRENFGEDYFPGSPSTWIGPLKPIRPTRPPNNTHLLTTTAADTRPLPPSETTTRVSTLFPRPPLPPPVVRLFTYNPKTSKIFNFFMMSKRMNERTDYTPKKRSTKANRITPMIHRPQKIGHTLSKAQAWVRNKQWTKTSKAPKTTDGSTNEGGTKDGLRTSEPDLLPPTGFEEITETANMGGLLQEDAEGFLFVSLPASTSESVTSPPTVAGDVLISARNFTRPSSNIFLPNKKYYDLMDEWDEGYMMVFVLQLCRLVSLKREEEVRDVLLHAELIMNGFHETGEIAWVGERIMDMFTRICGFASESGTHNMVVLRSYAGMFYQMLKERDMFVSVEMNSIIDYADTMYEDDEGDALFDAVREFDEYPNPNVTKTSREICLNLILAFLRPYKRLKTAVRCHRLLDAVNKAIVQRFGERRANGELSKLGATVTTKPNHLRERKRRNNSLKRRISIKRHLINRTKHQDSNEDIYRRQIIQAAEHPMLRSVLPITRHQGRFRVITPRQLISNAYLNVDRSTKEYFSKRLRRPVHPPNDMLQFFPQATKASKNKRRMQPTEGKRDNI